MTKRYVRLLVALIIVAVIAIGAYAGVTVYKNNENKKLQEEANKNVIFKFNVNDIHSLKIRNSAGDYVFEVSDNSEWVMTSGDGIAFKSSKLASICNTISDLTADSILTENPDDLSKYGLDNPMIINAVTYNDDENSLEIGKQVPGESVYYVKVTGKDTIYLISSDYVDNLWAERENLKDTYIFDVNNTNDINYFRFEKDGKTVYDLSRDGDGNWTNKEPFPDGKVNSSQVVSILSQVTRSSCVSFGEENPDDLSKLGFDNPSFELELKTDSKDVNMIFGDYYDEDHRYIYGYNAEQKQVYIFEFETVGCLETITEDVMQRELRNEYFGNITGFSLDILGQKIEIDFKYDPKNPTVADYKLNGEVVDTNDETTLNAFNLFIFSITGIAYDQICENVSADELNKEPSASVIYHLTDGTDYKLEFIQKSDDDKYFYIKENGKYLNVLARRYILEEGILKSYNDVMELM